VSTLEFRLREGWTLRKVATTLVREWLPPFRAAPGARAARWVVQSVVEAPGGVAEQLWEPGISTREYEERLERPDLCWAIRASSGRGRGTILARLALKKEQPETLQMLPCQTALPEALFDQEKLEELLQVEGPPAVADLFAALLTHNGFQPASS